MEPPLTANSIVGAFWKRLRDLVTPDDWVPGYGRGLLGRRFCVSNRVRAVDFVAKVTTRCPPIWRLRRAVVQRICHELSSTLLVVLEDVERSEEHTSELQSRENLVCRLLL